jgi:dTDP-4-amino-4,6-dideoxygalactose transaminase
MILFNDLRPAIQAIQPDIDNAIKRVVDSGIFLAGENVAAFEEEWARYCGADYCVACGSGTDALTLAAKVFHEPFKVSLATAANGCKFTAIGLERGCLSLDYYDVDEHGHCDIQHIVPVLLYGRQWHPYKDGASVLFDACQAHGWKPPRDSIVSWSGYPTKNLGGFGDCGWITTDDPRHSISVRRIASEWHSRMSEINAAVLRVKLPHLDEWNIMRKFVADFYYDSLPDWCEPVCRPGEPSNHHIFAILVDRRDELLNHLLANGVQCKVHYREPLADLPGANRWCSRVLSLPMYPGLKPEQIQTVCDVIRTFK